MYGFIFSKKEFFELTKNHYLQEDFANHFVSNQNVDE
jgi:hypothetical protein